MTLRAHKIILMGMPGSGKSTLGRRLSDNTGLPFLDLDEEIEKSEGNTIANIFSNKGETYFRQLEKKILRKVFKNPEFILATGGGTPCFFDNMSIIKKWGTSIFINVPIEELVLRMDNMEKGKRPKLSSESEDLTSIMLKLLKNRLPFYAQADFEWDYDRPIEELLAMLKER